MSLKSFITHTAEVFRTYDKTHHRNSAVDCLGALTSIVFTSIGWWFITEYGSHVPGDYLAILLGIVKGVQLYFGIALLTSLAGFVFDTFSPYRHVISALVLVVALVIFIVTGLTDLDLSPEFFGMILAMFFVAYSNAADFMRLLIANSGFSSRWRELSENQK